MIEAQGLTKRYGNTLAVDGLTFTVRPGAVTGFLGPNGAGKSTTMRMVLGLDAPTAGSVTIDGVPYERLPQPLTKVGALLDASWIHPNRSARSHLRWLAAEGGLPRSRVDAVLDLVGLRTVATKRAGGFSLGMKQRLGIAGAMLGDPPVLLFDEPVNGLDPEGVHWMRGFMQRLAAEGRTVFVSSHLLSEMALTAAQLIVIGRGRLIADCSTDEFIARASGSSVRVRTPDADAFAAALARQGLEVARSNEPGYGTVLTIARIDSTDRIGELAAAERVTLHELSLQRASLEAAFMELTGDAVEYQSAPAPMSPTGATGATGPVGPGGAPGGAPPGPPPGAPPAGQSSQPAQPPAQVGAHTRGGGR